MHFKWSMVGTNFSALLDISLLSSSALACIIIFAENFELRQMWKNLRNFNTQMYSRRNRYRSHSVQLHTEGFIFHTDSKPSVKYTYTRKRICITVWQPHYIRRTRHMNTFVSLQPQRFIIIGWNLQSFSRRYNYDFGLSIYFNTLHALYI